MGQRGPVPSRSDQRVRRNKDQGPIDKITVIGQVAIPELDLNQGLEVHPMAQDLYDSLAESAQSRYYEPSDWQAARLAVFFLNRLLHAAKPSAEQLATVNSMLNDLLVTEGQRRRVRLEVERSDSTGDASVTSLSDLLKERLGAQ